MSWAIQLETASYGGVEFQVESLSDSLIRRLAEYRYPGRDGADVEDLGREARRTTLSAIFHGDDYETQLGQLVMVVNAAAVETFVHPVLGTWQARAQIRSIRMDHSRRDTALVELEVIETGTDQVVDDLFSLTVLTEEIDAHVVDINAANTANVATVTDAASTAAAWASELRSRASAVASKVNQVRAKIDRALQTMDELTTPSNWPIVRSLKRLSYSCHKAGVKAKGIVPPTRSEERHVPAPLALIAQRAYGDGRLQSRLLEANPSIRNPLVVQPGEIKIPGEGE